MKALLSLAVVAALSFAGCAAKGSDETTTDGSSGTAGSTGSASGTASGSAGTSAQTGSATTGAVNRAPVVSAFTTNLTVGGLTSVVAGKGVKFTFNATDLDKDNLTFRLVFGDKTTNATGKMPTKGVNHTYAAAGNFTAKVFVSDGKLTVNKTLLVKVSVPTAGSTVKRTQVIEGDTLIPFPVGDLLVCIGDDIDGNSYTLDPAGPGWDYVLEPSSGFGIYWQKGGAYDSTADSTSGKVPNGIDGVEICNVSAGPMASYKLTLTEP